MKGKQKATTQRTRTYAKGGKVKPEIPVALESDQAEAVSDEEFEEMMRFAAEMQAGERRADKESCLREEGTSDGVPW